MKYSNIKCQNAIQVNGCVCCFCLLPLVSLDSRVYSIKQCQQISAQCWPSLNILCIAVYCILCQSHFFPTQILQSHLSFTKVDFYNCTPFALRKRSPSLSEKKGFVRMCVCVCVCDSICTIKSALK